MNNQSNDYNAEDCLDLALELLIQVGKLNKCVVHRITKEENYKELYSLLEVSRYNERNAEWEFSTLYQPLTFTSINCLSEALLYLVDISILDHAETLKIIEEDSYVGVFKLLDRKIQQYNNLYCQKKAL